MRLETRQIQEFLLDHGADQLPHPGGSLYEHLVRVTALLAEWGADEELQLAGLCHALTEPGQVPFRDRFTGRTYTPPEPDIRAFTELTAANELDVIRHNPAMAARHGAALRQFFASARQRLTDAAWHARNQQPGTDHSARIEPGE